VSLRERKKQATRRRVINAARILLRDRGYESTTVDDIAAKAQISRMTFFNYFAGKEKLLEALASEMFADRGELLEEILACDPDSLDQLPQQLDKRLDSVVKYRAFLKMVLQYTRLFSNFQVRSLLANDPIADFLAHNHDSRIDVVTRAQAAGTVRTDIPADEICDLYFALRNEVIGRWLAERGAQPGILKDRSRRAMRVFLQGLKP
jgi:AcrR family transcriptional regulator